MRKGTAMTDEQLQALEDVLQRLNGMVGGMTNAICDSLDEGLRDIANTIAELPVDAWEKAGGGVDNNDIRRGFDNVYAVIQRGFEELNATIDRSRR
jgi:hypothetical protein